MTPDTTPAPGEASLSPIDQLRADFASSYEIKIREKDALRDVLKAEIANSISLAAERDAMRDAMLIAIEQRDAAEQRATAAKAREDALRARVKVLEEALGPFAEFAEAYLTQFHDRFGDHNAATVEVERLRYRHISTGHLETAHAALAQHDTTKPETGAS